ncbi:renin receptor isoform X3 [Magallana gigas]|uniref:renin receptor isoform X3 n=1 Tax=Magallana gigas TaxID=29159 RepID=UPI003340C4D0
MTKIMSVKMADKERSISLFQLFMLVIIGVCHAQELVVTHAPSYVTFQKQRKALPTSDVPNVITHTLGIQTDRDITWDGLAQSSLFKRPKANVLVSIVGHSDLGKKPLAVKNLARFPIKMDDPMVDIASLMNTLQGTFFDQSPLLLDAGLDNNFFDVHSDFDVFRKLPDTMRKMADRLLDSDSVQQRHTTGTLNSSRPSDLKLMGELQLIQDVINTMTDDFRKLYKDNVVVEVLTVNPGLGIYVRKTRSLMAVDDSNVNINLSKDYDENYPAIFNIILWLMIVMFVVIFGVSYGMWNIDPGRDSIIYRMTTTRLKKD